MAREPPLLFEIDIPVFTHTTKFGVTGHGPLARNLELRVAHAPEMPGTFSPPPQVSDPDIHHGTCATPCRDACRDR